METTNKLIKTSFPSLGSFRPFFDFFNDENFNVFPDLSHRNYTVDEQDDSVLLEVALPGVKKKDLDLGIEDGMLTIKLKEGVETKWFTKYERRFSLGRSLDPDTISAKMTDGILTVNIKRKKDSIPKIIEIK